VDVIVVHILTKVVLAMGLNVKGNAVSDEDGTVRRPKPDAAGSRVREEEV
jgi:hypothetical protein